MRSFRVATVLFVLAVLAMCVMDCEARRSHKKKLVVGAVVLAAAAKAAYKYHAINSQP